MGSIPRRKRNTTSSVRELEIHTHRLRPTRIHSRHRGRVTRAHITIIITHRTRRVRDAPRGDARVDARASNLCANANDTARGQYETKQNSHHHSHAALATSAHPSRDVRARPPPSSPRLTSMDKRPPAPPWTTTTMDDDGRRRRRRRDDGTTARGRSHAREFTFARIHAPTACIMALVDIVRADDGVDDWRRPAPDAEVEPSPAVVRGTMATARHRERSLVRWTSMHPSSRPLEGGARVNICVCIHIEGCACLVLIWLDPPDHPHLARREPPFFFPCGARARARVGARAPMAPTTWRG